VLTAHILLGTCKKINRRALHIFSRTIITITSVVNKDVGFFGYYFAFLMAIIFFLENSTTFFIEVSKMFEIIKLNNDVISNFDID